MIILDSGRILANRKGVLDRCHHCFLAKQDRETAITSINNLLTQLPFALSLKSLKCTLTTLSCCLDDNLLLPSTATIFPSYRGQSFNNNGTSICLLLLTTPCDEHFLSKMEVNGRLQFLFLGTLGQLTLCLSSRIALANNVANRT